MAGAPAGGMLWVTLSANGLRKSRCGYECGVVECFLKNVPLMRVIGWPALAENSVGGCEPLQ